MRFIAIIILNIVVVCLLCQCLQPAPKKIDKEAFQVIEIGKALENVGESAPLKLSTFIDTVIYIPLQNGIGDTLVDIGQGARVLTDSYIYIGSKLFSRDGWFITKLGQVGRGPNEFIMLRDEAISEKRNEYYALTNNKSEILVYDLQNNFLRKFSVHNGRDNIFVEDKNVIVSRQYGLWDMADSLFFEFQVLDHTEGKVIAEKKQPLFKEGYSHKCLNGMSKNSFWSYNLQLFYYEAITDSIFLINPDYTLTPKYKLEFGDKKMSFEQMTDVKDWVIGTGVNLYSFTECDNYLFFSLFYKKKRYSGCYDKQNNQTHLYESDKMFVNDIDGFDFNGFWSAIDNGEAFDAIYPADILDDPSDNSKALQMKLPKLSENGNPVVRIFKFKTITQ